MVQRWSFLWRRLDSRLSSALADSDVHPQHSEALRDYLVYLSTTISILLALSPQSLFAEVLGTKEVHLLLLRDSAYALHVFTLFRCVGRLQIFPTLSVGYIFGYLMVVFSFFFSRQQAYPQPPADILVLIPEISRELTNSLRTARVAISPE